MTCTTELSKDCVSSCVRKFLCNEFILEHKRNPGEVINPLEDGAFLAFAAQNKVQYVFSASNQESTQVSKSGKSMKKYILALNNFWGPP